MSLTGRPHVRLKSPADPPLHGDTEPLAVEPEHAIPYLETLQEILDLTREMEQRTEDNNGNLSTLCRLSDLSTRVWAEVESLPLTTARSMAMSVEAYKSILQKFRAHLEEGTMNEKVEKRLNVQLDLFLKEFNNKIAMARSSIQPAGESSSFFRNIHQLLITGGNFINHIKDTELREICEQTFRSVSASGDTSIVLRDDIARLQATSEKNVRAVHCLQTVVLFY